MHGSEVEPEGKKRQVSNPDERKNQDSIRPLRPCLRWLGGVLFHESRAEANSPIDSSLTLLRVPPVREVDRERVLPRHLLITKWLECRRFVSFLEDSTAVNRHELRMSARTDEPPVLPLVPRPVASCSVRFLDCSRHELVHLQPQTTQAGAKSTCSDSTFKAAQPARFVSYSHNATYHFNYFRLRWVDKRRRTNA